MKLLALDTATEACSSALFLDGKIHEIFSVSPRKHGELILNEIDGLLSDAGVNLQSLDALAFGCGPGSFTGVRIAASVIQGLALASDLPIVPVSTLKALAELAFREHQKSRVFSVIDARMQEVYFAAYERQGEEWVSVSQESVDSVSHIDFANFNNFTAIGSGSDAYSLPLPNIPNQFPHAKDIALLAVKEFKEGRVVSAEEALPHYLRDRVVHQK